MTSPHEEAPLDAQAAAQRWEAIDWGHIERRVNKLQSRITKATQDGKLHLVRRLQHVLKNSFHAKLLAVRRVTTNQGKRAAGIDGAIWSTAASKDKAALSLTPRGYHARPLRRVFIEKKGKTKKRP